MAFSSWQGHACPVQRMRAVWLWTLVLFAVSWFMPAAHAAPSVVYFGGVAFTGNAADTAKDFPHLSRLLNTEGNRRINAAIRSALQSQPAAFDVQFDQLGSIHDASKSTALALAIDRETTSVEHIGSIYKVRTEIAAQVLFFDFKEKQVLGGFPLVLDYIDTQNAPPSDEAIQADFQHLALDVSDPHGLVAAFLGTLRTITVPNAASRHLRVTQVTLAPKAVEYIQQAAPTQDQETLKTQIAQEFGKYLSANQKLAVLPYQSNQALGASMAARFIEGEAYQLKIPEADYTISLDVAGFKKLEQARSNVSTLLLYGAFVDINVREPLSGKEYFAQRVKQGATKDVPITQTSVDDWSATYESLLLLFSNFTRAPGNADTTWAKSALPDSRDAKTQLTTLAELIKSCR